jgi:hypothetical protein
MSQREQREPMEEAEYIEERTVQEFLDWIDRTNNDRQANGQTNAYRERTGLWKKYADEAEPIMRFLHANAEIPRDSRIRLFTDTNAPDATLTTAGGPRQIETTTTDNPVQVHGRNQLNKYGFGPGDTHNVTTAKDLATRKKSGDPRDLGEPKKVIVMVREELDRIRDRLVKKLQKKYPDGTLLIVDSRSSSLDDTPECDVAGYLSGLPLADSNLEIWITIFPRRSFRLN